MFSCFAINRTESIIFQCHGPLLPSTLSSQILKINKLSIEGKLALFQEGEEKVEVRRRNIFSLSRTTSSIL